MKKTTAVAHPRRLVSIVMAIAGGARIVERARKIRRDVFMPGRKRRVKEPQPLIQRGYELGAEHAAVVRRWCW